MLAQKILSRPLTANLRWSPFSSVPHVSDHLELHNNNWASGILHPGPSESDVYSDVIQETQSNDLLHTVRLLMCLDTPLQGNNARGAKYAVYYASVATHTVFENIKWLRSELCRIRNVAVPSLACLFHVLSVKFKALTLTHGFTTSSLQTEPFKLCPCFIWQPRKLQFQNQTYQSETQGLLGSVPFHR